MKPRDLIIIGGGVCGLSCALIAAQNGLRPLVIDMGNCGGQLLTWIESPLKDIPSHLLIDPKEVLQTLMRQCHNESVEFLVDSRVHEVQVKDDHLHLFINNNQELHAQRVFISSGLIQRKLDVSGEETIPWGNPHTPLDRKDTITVVIGGGDEACSTAADLADSGAHVIMIVRGNLRARIRFAERVIDNPSIKIMENERVIKFTSSGVILSSGQDITCDECFIRIGMEPIFPRILPQITTFDDGRIHTDTVGKTSISRLYAGGDVTRPPNQRYVAIAMADGVRIGRSIADDLVG